MLCLIFHSFLRTIFFIQLLNFMKKTIKIFIMAMLCFFGKDRQSSFNVRSQAKNPIRILAWLNFEDFKFAVKFRCNSKLGRTKSEPQTLSCCPFSLLIYRNFK